MSDAPTIALIDRFHPGIVAVLREALPPDWELAVAALDGPAEAEEARALALESAEIAFVMAAPMPAGLLRRAPRLRFIQKLGAGTDRIDADFCARHGIALARLEAGNAVPVAEHALMLILAAYRRLPVLDRQTRAGLWDKEQARGVNRQLHGKTVGIVGFGAIGRALARLLAGFEVEIVYHDPVPAPAEVETALRARRVPLDTLLARADVVSLHMPLVEETAGLIDAAAIAAMKPGALVVNCARGGLVDEAALAGALAEGRLFAAALDAFAAEPPVGSPLLAFDNTVVTPHAAGATLDNFAQIAERAIANARRVLAGEALPAGDAVVDPAAMPARAG